MYGFKNKLIRSISSMANFVSPTLLQKISRQNLILPFYHSIFDTPLPHIKHLYQVKNKKQFEKDLDFLLKYYEPISYSQFDNAIKNNKKFSKPSFLLSFDDGLSEFYELIAPVLLKKGIPAICFLNDAFIDNKSLFYRYKASILIEEYDKNPDTFDKIISEFNIKNLKNFVLGIKYDNKHLLDKIALNIGYDFNDYLNDKSPYLTTQQIYTLINDGFYFGSHSFDHPEYRYLDLKQQLEQTIKSVDDICEKFELDYRIFSFPFTDFGVSKVFFEKIFREGNIRYSFGSAGQKKDTATENFQRIPLEIVNLTAKEIINSELIYYIAKGLIGKNIIYRK